MPSTPRIAPWAWTGPAAVVTLWTTVATGMAVTGLGFLDDRPVSYLGTDGRTVLLFQAGLLSAAALLVAFTFSVRTVFPAPPSFVVASLLGLGGQAVAAVVPLSGPGASPTLHLAGGLLLGISLPVLMWRFASGQPPGRWRATAYRLFWLEAAACVAGVVLSRSGLATLAEIFPAVAFHLWIATVALVASRRSSETFGNRLLSALPPKEVLRGDELPGGR